MKPIRTEEGIVVLRYRSSRIGGLACYWASRALHDPALPDEDREMALAAYSRAFDVQMGTVGKGRPKTGVRESYPFGGDFIREADARRAAEARAAREAADALEADTLLALADVPYTEWTKPEAKWTPRRGHGHATPTSTTSTTSTTLDFAMLTPDEQEALR